MDPWTMLIEERAATALQDLGVRFPAAKTAQLSARGLDRATFFEIEIWPLAHLVPSTIDAVQPSPCLICGRLGVRMHGQAVVQEASVPGNMDVFRIWEAPTYVLASERFAEAVRSLGLSGTTFTEVELASGAVAEVARTEAVRSEVILADYSERSPNLGIKEATDHEGDELYLDRCPRCLNVVTDRDLVWDGERQALVCWECGLWFSFGREAWLTNCDSFAEELGASEFRPSGER
jgi:hypothetical protein